MGKRAVGASGNGERKKKCVLTNQRRLQYRKGQDKWEYIKALDGTNSTTLKDWREIICRNDGVEKTPQGARKGFITTKPKSFREGGRVKGGDE